MSHRTREGASVSENMFFKMRQYFINFNTCKRSFFQNQRVKKWKSEAKDFKKKSCRKKYKFSTEQHGSGYHWTGIYSKSTIETLEQDVRCVES